MEGIAKVQEKEPNVGLYDELKSLQSAPIVELRQRYRDLFRREPPKAFGPDLLRRSIAYRLQERAFGGLSKSCRRQLDELVAQIIKNPAAKIHLPRRIMQGAVLVRQFKGKSHRVMMMEQGYSYEGKVYPSLSEIARLITGTRWNGPRFFGLRKTVDPVR